MNKRGNCIYVPIVFSMICLSFIFSCVDEKTQLFYNEDLRTIKELAQKENKPFCVVLTRENCPPCEMFLNSLQFSSNKTLQKALFNIVDASLPENEWYTQWVGVSGVPCFYVFSNTADLQAILSGVNEKALDCLESSIRGDASCAKYQFRGDFKVEAKGRDRIFELLNDVLKCKEKLDAGEDISEEINKNLREIEYPYNIYLKAKNEFNKGNAEIASEVAKELLPYRNNKLNLIKYSSIFEEIQYIIDPDFNPENEPQLFVDNNPIHLDNYERGTMKKINIKLSNVGRKQLKIIDLKVDCTCLTYNGEKSFEIEVGKSKEIEVEFESDDPDKISRHINIFSNALFPIETISIVAE